MLTWFGPADLVYCGDLVKVATPVDIACGHCAELITFNDTGFVVPHGAAPGWLAWHYACWLRQLIGGVNNCAVVTAGNYRPIRRSYRAGLRRVRH